MATSAEQTLHEAMEAFNFSGAPVGALRFGQGHINDTFCLHVERGEERFRLLEQALAEDPLGRGTPFLRLYRSAAGEMDRISTVCKQWEFYLPFSYRNDMIHLRYDAAIF